MELIHMNRDKLAALPAALPMKANDTDLAEIAAIEYPSAVYVNRSTWHVLTEHSRRAMLATTLEEIPVLLVEIQEEKEIAAAAKPIAVHLAFLPMMTRHFSFAIAKSRRPCPAKQI